MTANLQRQHAIVVSLPHNAGCGDVSLLSKVVERDDTLLLELKETKTDI